MPLPQTIGEKGRDDVALFACPLCHRTGYSAAGLKNHRCPSLTRDGRGFRQRLSPELVARALGAH